MEIGKKITKLRKEKGLTQKDLADALHISDKAISRWESGNGNPDIDIIPDIAKFFNVSIDYLFGKEDKPHKEETIKDNKGNNKLRVLLLSYGVAIFLIAFIVSISIFLSYVVSYSQAMDKAAQEAILGLNFPPSELADKTIQLATMYGVEGLTVDDATFVQWQNILLEKYVFRQDLYWWHTSPIWDNNYLYLIIPMVLSIGGFIPSLIYQLKYIRIIKKDGKSNSKETR